MSDPTDRSVFIRTTLIGAAFGIIVAILAFGQFLANLVTAAFAVFGVPVS